MAGPARVDDKAVLVQDGINLDTTASIEFNPTLFFVVVLTPGGSSPSLVQYSHEQAFVPPLPGMFAKSGFARQLVSCLMPTAGPTLGRGLFQQVPFGLPQLRLGEFRFQNLTVADWPTGGLRFTSMVQSS